MIAKISFFLTEQGQPELDIIYFDVTSETDQNYVCKSTELTKQRIKKSMMNEIIHSYPNNPEVVGYHCYVFHHRVPGMLQKIRVKVEKQTAQTIETLKALQKNLGNKFDQVASSQEVKDLSEAYSYESTEATLPGTSHRITLFLIKGPTGDVIGSEVSEQAAMSRVDELMIKMTLKPIEDEITNEPKAKKTKSTDKPVRRKVKKSTSSKSSELGIKKTTTTKKRKAI